jgi:hypothetical protein
MAINVGDRIDLGSGGSPDKVTVQSVSAKTAVVTWDDGDVMSLNMELLEWLALHEREQEA